MVDCGRFMLLCVFITLVVVSVVTIVSFVDLVDFICILRIVLTAGLVLHALWLFGLQVCNLFVWWFVCYLLRALAYVLKYYG